MEFTSEVEKLNSRLSELFALQEGFVVILNGEWGIGKTYFWNSFVDKKLSHKLENKEVAYVSLFGKETLKDIQTDIVLQISSINRIYEKINSFVGSSKIAGIDVSSVLSFANKTDFKDIVICFDDFERKSKKLDTKDILGLISQLKEQKKCKIIMIYNQNEVGTDDKEIVSSNKDKIIDYELHYKPTVAESFNAVSSHLIAFKSYPLEYFESKGINNIRVIKRVINTLNDFKFIEEKVNKYPYIEAEIAYDIIKLALLNAKFDTYNLEDLSNYLTKKRFDDKGKKETREQEKENMLFLLDNGASEYFIPTDILHNIDYYIKNSIIDKEGLIRIVDNKIKLNENDSINQKIKDIHSQYRYDLNYSEANFKQDMFIALEEGGDNIVSIASPESFMYFMDELMLIDKDPKYEAFAIESLKKYLDQEYKKDSIHNLKAFGKLQKITDYKTTLKEYAEMKESELHKEQIQTMENIVHLLHNPIKNKSWGDEPILLEMIDKEVYKKYIIESPEFLKDITHFISWTQRFVGHSGFENVVKKFIEVLNELKESNEVYKFKIEKLLKYLSLT